MSDKPLPITLTGMYKGYEVAVQVEASLDSLDKLVERMQARGIEPLFTPQAAPSGKGRSKPKDTVAGVVREIRPAKPGCFKFDLDDGTDPAPLRCIAFKGMADSAAQRLTLGASCTLVGTYQTHETYGTSFIVTGISDVQQRAA
jgi:hypothetical protein